MAPPRCHFSRPKQPQKQPFQPSHSQAISREILIFLSRPQKTSFNVNSSPSEQKHSRRANKISHSFVFCCLSNKFNSSSYLPSFWVRCAISWRLFEAFAYLFFFHPPIRPQLAGNCSDEDFLIGSEREREKLRVTMMISLRGALNISENCYTTKRRCWPLPLCCVSRCFQRLRGKHKWGFFFICALPPPPCLVLLPHTQHRRARSGKQDWKNYFWDFMPF